LPFWYYGGMRRSKDTQAFDGRRADPGVVQAESLYEAWLRLGWQGAKPGPMCGALRGHDNETSSEGERKLGSRARASREDWFVWQEEAR
jgi:hypothetical protein